jgi:hypothetical protein
MTFEKKKTTRWMKETNPNHRADGPSSLSNVASLAFLVQCTFWRQNKNNSNDNMTAFFSNVLMGQLLMSFENFKSGLGRGKLCIGSNRR